MEQLLASSSSWMNLLGSVGILFAGHIANKYIIPFLKIGKRKQYAQYIATIADEVTDDLKSKYEEKEWLKHLDEAVDMLISICDISPVIATRAVKAAAARK